MSALLQVQGLSKRFGGLVVLDDITFEISKNSVHSIIGPNGAGKTTVLNIIFGLIPPTAGRVVFRDRSILGLRPHRIARLGLSRTFQTPQLCLNLGVLENVMLGAQQHLDESIPRAMLRSPKIVADDAKCRSTAEEILRFVRLEEYLNDSAGALPYGALKRLEIARAMAADAEALLLDEPAAGLNAQETEQIEDLIGRLKLRGATVVLVEHDMNLVMRMSDKVTVLHNGRVLSEGAPEEVRRNREVIQAYLGAPRAPDAVRQVRAIRESAAAKEPAAETVLKVRGVQASYGKVKVLHDISLDVGKGELVALLGANGAGKTTLLRCIQGLQAVTSGTISFMGRDVTALRADKRKHAGICQCPEGRQLFAPLTVEDNLRLGAYGRPTAEVARDMERMFEAFPVLKERRREVAGLLSGGQQQMLSIGRALMGNPTLLLLDEPSMGLAPTIVQELFQVIAKLRAEGTTILLVEQNANEALRVADKGYVLQTGRIVLSGTAGELLDADRVRSAYLGAAIADDGCTGAEQLQA